MSELLFSDSGRTGHAIVTRWLPVEVKAGEGAPGGSGPAGEDATGGVTISASVESEDRAGDVILASGWELEAYSRNPVVLWAHQHLSPPIGRSVRTWVDGKSLKAAIEFAPTEFGQAIGRLYEKGFLRGVSVGFRALETEPRKSSRGTSGVLFRRQELLEISAAPVPLNAEALAAARPLKAEGEGDDGMKEAVDLLKEMRELWSDLSELQQTA